MGLSNNLGKLSNMITSTGSAVGIGTTSTGFNVAGLPLVVGSGIGNTGMTIFSGNASSGSIHFADTETTGDGSFAGFINYSHTTNSMQFGTTGATPLERMRITSAGNVGIGTTTINEILDIEGNMVLRNSGTYSTSLSRGFVYRSSTASFGVQPIANITFLTTGDAASAMTFTTRNGAADYNERMRITSGGNVGVGCTPSAWGVLNPAIEMGTGGSFISGQGSTSALYLGTNTYYNGSNFIYKNNGAATYSIQNSGAHIWYNASSGTAGNTVSFVETMRIASNSQVFVGTTLGLGGRMVVNNNASAGIDIFDGSNAGGFIRFFNNGASPIGSIVTTNGFSTTYNSTSDYRLKEDLKELNGLDKVLAIKIYDYKWKTIEERMDGVLAHELAEILPYAVTGEKDGEEMQGVDYSKIVPVLVKAIQELNEKLIRNNIN